MGDKIYISFWDSKIQGIINHFESGKTEFSIDVAGLEKFGDRQNYYSNFRIVRGELEISRNAYAQGRDFHEVLTRTRYFKENLSSRTLHILISKDLKLQIKMTDNDSPEFFNQDDFSLLKRYPGIKYDKKDPEMSKVYLDLKKVYEKVEYWGNEVLKRVFPKGVIHVKKRPTNQANKFEDYLWAKLYPSEELKKWKSLAYTVTFSNREDFCVKIDTIGGLNENNPIRKKYLGYRGDFFNSPIVKIFKPAEILGDKWETLITKSVNTLKSIEGDYDKLLSMLRGEPTVTSTPLDEESEVALNTIYYGPPGTGKTFKLNQLKVELFTDAGITKSQDQILREQLTEYAFWQVIAAALNSSKGGLTVTELIQHPLVKGKINPSIKTKPRNLIWGNLQTYADDSSTELTAKYRRSIKIFNKDKNGKWSIAKEKEPEIADIIDPTLLDLASNLNSIKPKSESEIKRYSFVTFHQKYSYEDFIEGIKPVLRTSGQDDIDELSDPTGQLAFELKKGIFYHACLESLKLAGYSSFEECYKDSRTNRATRFDSIERTREKQFAIFIDEINRANISAVFGELITLIEDNKRIGSDEEMWLQLPYSSEPFGVPKNLFLIGSMNTADRSIALLDIALRRRFEFRGIYPDYDSIPEWSAILQKMNQRIYDLKKNPDFFIGHAFFIDQDIEDKVDIFNTKIIPLLLEYFQNNLGTVRSILTEAEIKTEEPSIANNFQLIAID